MKPIPKTAKSVAKFIKDNVPRPPLPKLVEGRLRWTDDLYGTYCPLGLLPCAVVLYDNDNVGPWLIGTPAGTCHFTPKDAPGTDKQIKTFFRWWDSLEKKDAKAAINAIWGKK